jgi:IS30 family transposase
MNLDEQERLSVVQVDSVEGIKSDKQAILTLHFVRFAFQIPLLLAEQTSVWVVKAFDALEQMCEGNFSKHFSLILTDRGSEFLAYEKLEHARDGHKRCRVYYCDPGRADQKGACEKNHEEIRKILPKKTSFELLTPVDMATIASHINSYSRKSLGGKTPLDLAATVLPQSLLDSLGIQKVDPDKVNLTPELLNLSLRN